MSSRHGWSFGILASISLIFSACDSKKEPDPEPENEASIVSFQVNPESVQAGEMVTASWQTKDAVAVRLSANGEAVDLGGAEPGQGSVTVPVTVETRFVLAATGAGGDEVTSEKTVRIIGDAPVVISFVAEPAELDDVGTVSLTWETRNADTVRMTRAGGAEVDLGAASAEEGSVSVTVAGTETFTLVAERGAEQDSRTVTVKVKGTPEASFSIAPALITFGDEATISWETTDAASVTIADANGNELEGGPFEVQGTRTIRPEVSTTYWLTAVGAASKETKVSASIEVRPVVLSFEATDPSPAAVGDPKVLVWKTGGALEVEISNLDGEPVKFLGNAALEGTATLPMGAEGTFRIVARSGSLVAQSEVRIDVVVDPEIGSFTVDRNVVSLVDGTATVTLSWTGIARADGLELVGDTTGPIDLDGAEGTIDVEIDADTVFTLTARNAAGTASRTVEVRAVPLPVVESFTALPGYVGPGEEVALTWSTTGVTNVEIFQNGVAIPGPHAPSDSLVVNLNVSADFEIVVYNDAFDSATETASVTVGQPQIATFAVSDSHVWVGEAVVFTWESLGASTLEISSADGTSYSTSIPADVAEGESAPIVLSDEGTFTFTLEVKNLSGQVATRTLTVRASTGPGITSFAVAPAAILQGAQIAVSWAATPDPDGTEPTLTLTADRGGPYTLPAGSSGTTQFTLSEVGAHEFTFTASTAAAGSTPATRTETVQVFGTPSVTFDANPLVFDDEVHSGVTLSWVSTNADQSLEIYEIDPGGTDVLLYSVPAADRATGSFVANAPTDATTYRIVATNGLSMTAQADVSVTMQPAEVLTFTATPPVYPEPPAPPTIGAIAGDTVLLEWTTHKADTVALDILSGLTFAFSETAEPFVDISTTGTRATLPHNWCSSCTIGDEGQGVITFPAGFTFPFGGVDRTEAMVYSNGLLSFDPHIDVSGMGTSFTNESLATTAKSWAHMAIFWDDLQFQNANATGDIWYGPGTDARGDYLAIQWKGQMFTSTTADMNFEILLRPDGSFEYRYGTMQPITATQGAVDGNGATIGYMLPGRTSFHVFSHNTAVPGGLANRSFRYENPPTLSSSGSYAWLPIRGAGPTNRTVKLTATNAHNSDEETLTVVVHPRATLTATAPATAIRNQNFTLTWTTQNATAVTVEDQTGTTRCTAAAGQIASGNCVLTEATGGPKTYTVIATGALGHTVTKNVDITITSADFGISSFTAIEDEIGFNESVTLSWVTGDADELRLLANGVEVALPPTIDLAEDSFTLTLQESTTFVLEIENTLFGTRTATKSVTVRTATLALTPSETNVKPGTPVSISWATTSLNGGPVTVEVPFLEMVEDTTGPGFQDISQLPGVATLVGSGLDTTMSNHTLAGGFTFPFGGTTYTSLRVSPDGYVSFDTSTTTVGTNVPIPTTNSTDRRANLAPFWDNLHTRTNGRVYAAPVGSDYVIQWTKMSPTTGSSSTDEWNLNFQVVLHPDGSFEYRYGTMAPRATPSTSCFPDTCENEANGSSATIGYQNAAGTAGFMLHYGGSAHAAGNPAFPGNLSNRTFRYDLPTANGLTTFIPRASGDYTVCVNQGAYRKCETLRVNADFKIDSFDALPAAIDWGQAFDFSWATTGADTLAIKQGTTVVVDDATVAIASGTFNYVPVGTATYTLEVKNHFLNQTLTATKTVSVRQFDVALTSSATTPVNPGDPVTLTWTANMLSGGSMVLATPMTDVTGTIAYADISSAPGVVQVIGASADTTMADHTFQNGFTFNYLGTERSMVRVSTDGFISFDSAASTTSGNLRIPTTASERKVHLAAFWDDLNTRANGRVYAAQVGTDYVFQWSGMSMHTGSGTTTFHDLNFQIVLHADGSFTYVYGTMAGLSGTNTSTSCFPNTCVNEANGASATIGYQDPSGVAGHLIHFGGTTPAAGNFPVVGGLSNRAFRFTPHTTSGSVVVNPTDLATYKVCAISGTFVECSAAVTVNAGWTIKSFHADARSALLNQPVTLTWDTAGGDAISLVATVGGVDTVLPIAGDAGTYVDTLQGKTTYKLTLGSFGRMKTATVVVEERNAEVSLAAVPQVLFPGDSSTLSWAVSTHTAGPLALEGPMLEMTGAGTSFADLDISQDPTVQVLHLGNLDDNRATVTFQNGFTFPYMGTARTAMAVSVNGWISFTDLTNSSTRHSNAVIPTTDSTNKTVHLAPFWDDLHTRTSGRVYGLQVDPDTYVVQWSKISPITGSSLTAEYDLNFMVVLHSDGRFEYRYGTMAPPATPQSGCSPATCVNEAMGSSASIGYQDPNGVLGRMIHFGGSSSGTTNPVFSLANRTFVYQWSTAGTTSVAPNDSTEYQLCAILDGYKECSAAPVTVLKPGSMTITELVVDPAGGPGGEWFEIKNTTGVPVDLGGWTIATDGGSHAIAGPLVVPPGGFATLAASAAAGFVPDYFFGAGLPIDATGDTLSLEASPTLTIASVTWDGTWTHPASGSLSLDGSFVQVGVGSHDDPTRWCSGAPSPGEMGDGCKNTYYSLDRYSEVPFLDITASGIVVSAVAADGGTAEIPVPFSMPFYGTTVTKIWANSNGYVSFAPTSPTNAHFAPDTLPRSATASPTGPLVAAFWDDIGCTQSIMRFQYEQRTIGTETVTILQWNDFLRCSNPGRTTFQVQLWSGGDVAIVFGHFEGGGPAAQRTYAGNLAWTALEGPNRTEYFTANFRQPTLMPRQSILFRAK